MMLRSNVLLCKTRNSVHCHCTDDPRNLAWSLGVVPSTFRMSPCHFTAALASLGITECYRFPTAGETGFIVRFSKTIARKKIEIDLSCGNFDM